MGCSKAKGTKDRCGLKVTLSRFDNIRTVGGAIHDNDSLVWMKAITHYGDV